MDHTSKLKPEAMKQDVLALNWGLLLKYSSLYDVKSAQKAEFLILFRTCKLAKEQRVNIYTDSKYALE